MLEVTENVPVVKPVVGVTVIAVVPCPDTSVIPDGIVQLYPVDPVTAEQVYTLLAVDPHKLTVPEILIGFTGIEALSVILLVNVVGVVPQTLTP